MSPGSIMIGKLKSFHSGISDVSHIKSFRMVSDVSNRDIDLTPKRSHSNVYSRNSARYDSKLKVEKSPKKPLFKYRFKRDRYIEFKRIITQMNKVNFQGNPAFPVNSSEITFARYARLLIVLVSFS